MEYLYRTFGKLANNPNFNYHSRCDKLGIVPLFFVDDFFVFTRGDIMFVDLTMKAFREIYVAKRLSVNPHKCKILLGNVDECTKQEILNVTSFSEGNLPFRYLRIPLTSKKLLMRIVDYLLRRSWLVSIILVLIFLVL